VEALLSLPGVTCSRDVPSSTKRFGSSGELKVGGKIFAMLSSKGTLVVKLPRPRVEALIASAKSARFDPGHGRLMKEWLSVEPASEAEWLSLARAALEFVAARH